MPLWWTGQGFGFQTHQNYIQEVEYIGQRVEYTEARRIIPGLYSGDIMI